MAAQRRQGQYRKVGDDGGSLREMVGKKKQREASDGEQSRAECV